jgi:hypothetical protein
MRVVKQYAPAVVVFVTIVLLWFFIRYMRGS